MPKKTDIKAVGIVVVGVILAGFVMNKFRDVEMVGQSRNGYGS